MRFGGSLVPLRGSIPDPPNQVPAVPPGPAVKLYSEISGVLTPLQSPSPARAGKGATELGVWVPFLGGRRLAGAPGRDICWFHLAR